MTKQTRTLFDVVSTIMDVWPEQPINLAKEGRSDKGAMQGDWEAVGNHLKSILNKVVTEQQAQPKGPDETSDKDVPGADKGFNEVAPEAEAEINGPPELDTVSIRLEKTLTEDLKLIAGINGIAYQALMRQVLKQFADREKTRILRAYITEIENQGKLKAEEKS